MKEPIIGFIAIIALVIGFTAATTGYSDVDLSQIVPLFKALIPYVLVVGFPVLIVATAIIIAKATLTGAHLAKDIVTHKRPRKHP
jgi:hypothetical protein